MRRVNRSIRFSDEEFEAVTRAAEKAGVERSFFIRQSAVNAASVINKGVPEGSEADPVLPDEIEELRAMGREKIEA